MAGRTYGQFCGLSRALDIVGERWALLIVRDLLVAPKRFTDLRRGLPRIPTNILSARLRELERAGVVHRRLLPRPAGSVVYELTPYGRELEEVVLRLGRWGAGSLGEPEPGEIVTADSLVMSLRATFRPDRARGLRVGYELRAGEVVVHVLVDDGALSAAEGALPGAGLVVESGVLHALFSGAITAEQAVAAGTVRLTGDPDLLPRLVEMFFVPPRPPVAPG
ncbi:winged helix-turn-helix transcriptional regulator [Sphaerisporangium sp. TRM90804]|uniref:winged helix-turn-helix transcriptional regulator n=1 Tax=Sphaerisporangium sp. TRM90804 TaxID=3031113 RepID=UPI00244CD81B|nr:winged helix-turn-helix transcriptional regulator [Sphaerisporangium sp. TRM90804]MDH2430857.1 winged helix-turn-helix transcriptional regulator [Sphaerisporangium sp. TRM90804]